MTSSIENKSKIQGFTIMETLVVALVFAVMFLAMMQSLALTQKAQRGLEIQSYHADLRSSVASVVFDSITCNASLGGQTYTNASGVDVGLASLSVTNNTKIVTVGDKISGLKMDSLKLLADSANSLFLGTFQELGGTTNKYLTILELKTSVGSNALGEQGYTDQFPLVVYTDSTDKITNCFGGVDPTVFNNGKVFQTSCVSIGGLYDSIKNICNFPKCTTKQYLSYQPSKGLLECRDLVRLCVIANASGVEIGSGFQTAVNVQADTWSNCIIQSCSTGYVPSLDNLTCVPN